VVSNQTTITEEGERKLTILVDQTSLPKGADREVAGDKESVYVNSKAGATKGSEKETGRRKVTIACERGRGGL